MPDNKCSECKHQHPKRIVVDECFDSGCLTADKNGRLYISYSGFTPKPTVEVERCGDCINFINTKCVVIEAGNDVCPRQVSKESYRCERDFEVRSCGSCKWHGSPKKGIAKAANCLSSTSRIAYSSSCGGRGCTDWTPIKCATCGGEGIPKYDRDGPCPDCSPSKAKPKDSKYKVDAWVPVWWIELTPDTWTLRTSGRISDIIAHLIKCSDGWRWEETAIVYKDMTIQAAQTAAIKALGGKG